MCGSKTDDAYGGSTHLAPPLNRRGLATVCSPGAPRSDCAKPKWQATANNRHSDGGCARRLAQEAAMRVTARKIQAALGLLWLLDGALQLQPFMFGRGFAEQIIAPTADGQPVIVAGGVHWAASLVLTHPAFYDAAFAAIQIALGIGLLVPATVRLALAASVGWALGVWYFGESLGGIASGHAMMLTGAPGAALLYAVLAVALWPRGRRFGGASWVSIAWATLWIGSAMFNLLPGQNSSASITDAINNNADDAPRWLAAIDHHVATGSGGIGWGLVTGLVVLQLVIGVGGLLRGRVRIAAAWTGALVSLAFWVVGQSIGELYSGQATDPSTAIVVVLFAAALVANGRIATTPIVTPIVTATGESFDHNESSRNDSARWTSVGAAGGR
jgi:hypothetical protein